MSHVILIAVTLDEVGSADDSDLVAGIAARLGEFYPLASEPAVPSRVTAAVVSPAAAVLLRDAAEVGLDAPDASDVLIAEASDAIDALDLGGHGYGA